MTYAVSYEGLEGDAKRAKALEDIVGYLGWEKFAALHQAILTDSAAGSRPTLRGFRIALSFAGVQGYPARAWFEHAYGADAPTGETEEPKS